MASWIWTCSTAATRYVCFHCQSQASALVKHFRNTAFDWSPLLPFSFAEFDQDGSVGAFVEFEYDGPSNYSSFMSSWVILSPCRQFCIYCFITRSNSTGGALHHQPIDRFFFLWFTFHRFACKLKSKGFALLEHITRACTAPNGKGL